MVLEEEQWEELEREPWEELEKEQWVGPEEWWAELEEEGSHSIALADTADTAHHQ